MNRAIMLKKTSTTAKALCVLSLAMACSPAWSDSGTPKYEMSVFSDAAQGSKILSGKYENAITNMTAKNAPSERQVDLQTNLCVAYAKSGQLEAAELACDKAVIAAKRLKRSTSSSFADGTPTRIRGRYLAIALSNRGVLRAVSGDLEAAKQDFDEALAQRSRISSIEANLAKLELYTEESV